MADSMLRLDIVTPTGPIKEAVALEVAAVEIPGVLGEMGVLPNHVPCVSPIQAGVVRFKSGDQSVRVAVGAGFVEISEDGRVTVLAARALVGAQVDTAQVKAALDTATKELTAAKDGEASERAALSGEIKWFEAQLRAAAN